MSFLQELLSNPTTALWVAMICPLAARFLVAWTVWLRVRGLPPASVNLEPQRKASHYPSPNDPVLAAAILSGGVVVAWFIATAVGWVLSGTNVPTWIWSSIFVMAAIGSLAYALNRIRADDRVQKRGLAERLATESATRRRG